MSTHPKPSRRDFLKISIAAGSAAVLAGAAPALAAHRSRRQSPAATPTTLPTLPNGVAAGDVSQRSAVLWAHSTAPGTLTFRYNQRSAWFDTHSAHVVTVEVTDTTLPVKAAIDHLQPGTEYLYRVTDAAGAQITGRFRTLALPGDKQSLHFGVTGDWRGELRPYAALANVAERSLDFFMEHGDTIYGDVPSVDFPGDAARTLADYRVKHNEGYSSRDGINAWADIRASTSVYATIDDHEVCNDFAGGAPPSTDPRFGQDAEYINQTQRYRDSMQAFREYNPVRDDVYTGTNDPRVEGRPKLYRYEAFGSTAAIFVLDARSFRDQSEPQIPPMQAVNPFAVVRSLASMFEPGRTMLGRPQVEQFKADLLAAHQAGVTWKFVMVPEPIQHMGWFGGVDRWEGYAPERTEVLKFVEDNAIRNVVFVAADVHTTFINNLTYQTEAGGAQIPTHCFEISTGPAAYYPPTGQIIMDAARQIGLLSGQRYDDYQAASIPGRDAMLEDLFNRIVLGLQGFTPLGLENSPIQYQRLKGGWVVGHTFGWTEFEVAPDTEALTITTWGVPAYTPEQAATSPQAVLALVPEIMSQLVITPQTA